MAKNARFASCWRAIALSRISALRADLAALPARKRTDHASTIGAIQGLLDEAAAAAQAGSRGGAWWSGAGIEQTWRSIHAADAMFVSLQPTDKLRVRHPDIVASARTLLPSNDQRRAAIESWLADHGGEPPETGAERARYEASLRWINSEADNSQARVRSFRNVLIAVTLAMALVAAGLIVVGIVAPRALPICVQPTVDDPTVVAEQPITQRICPTGHATPTGGDVPLVAFAGLVGAALASAMAIRKIHGTSTPYSVPLALGALKLPTGTLTAIAGLILIQGEFVPGLSALDDQAQVLSYAVLLGYGQELFTRFVDRQGQNLLNSAPGPDPLAPPRAHEPLAERGLLAPPVAAPSVVPPAADIDLRATIPSAAAGAERNGAAVAGASP